MNKEQESKIKKVSIGIIVLCILFFALVTCGEDTASSESTSQKGVDKSVIDEQKAQAKAEKEAEREKSKQQTERLVTCQMAIEKQLKNPKSFDTVFNTTRHAPDADTGGYIVGFDFYAKNSFNAEIIHQAACSFDANGNLDKALFAPK